MGVWRVKLFIRGCDMRVYGVNLISDTSPTFTLCSTLGGNQHLCSWRSFFVEVFGRKSNLIIPIDSPAVESIIAEILQILLLLEGESGGEVSQSIDLSFEYHYR